MRLTLSILLTLAMPCFAASPQRIGNQICATCHQAIAQTQSQTAMALTWQGKNTSEIPSALTERRNEGPPPDIAYTVHRTGQSFTFTTALPGHQPQTFPVETTMGGKRHGISFLLRVPEIEGLPLPRAPLIEARYLHYVRAHQLELSPGFPAEKPTNYETAIGRVLTPGFEHKCLTCHGQPRRIGTHTESGVTCEDCHGPGSEHLAALSTHAADLKIVNPARLLVNQQMQPCAQCHSGFSIVEDPLPDDLLISDQVTALSNSECWRQTGGQITCTNCHNPHQDATRITLILRSQATCFRCHSTSVPKHAAICPVNQKEGCVSCHMPDESKPPLEVADHWIRVHPDRPGHPAPHRAQWNTQVTPRHVWLRIIAMPNETSAAALRTRVLKGESFFDLARAQSSDKSSAADGGFLGDLTTDQLAPAWSEAALRLKPGDISPIIKTANGYVFLERMPRNFREDAEAVYNRAMALRAAGNRHQSAAQLLEALKIYPRLLRALTYLGVSYGESGNPQTGAAILSIATRLHPQDAGAHFNLAVAFGALQSPDELNEYQRALQIDPDLTTAYLNLGAAYYAKGQTDQAIEYYRKGIQANPLIASLHYSLGVALEHAGKSAEAEHEFALAQKIDPKLTAAAN